MDLAWNPAAALPAARAPAPAGDEGLRAFAWSVLCAQLAAERDLRRERLRMAGRRMASFHPPLACALSDRTRENQDGTGAAPVLQSAVNPTLSAGGKPDGGTVPPGHRGGFSAAMAN